MNKKPSGNPDNRTESPPKKHDNDNPDKQHPKPDDPNQQKGPPIKEMPRKRSARLEEIPDRTPK